MVTRIDRLARSVKDLQDIVHELKAKGVALKATEQPIDTGTAAGKAFLDMLGVFAEFETNLRRERQLEGIQAAKAKGVYKGRKPSIDPAEVRRLREAEGLGPSAIARRLGIGRASVYRVLAGKGGSDLATTVAHSTCRRQPSTIRVEPQTAISRPASGWVNRLAIAVGAVRQVLCATVVARSLPPLPASTRETEARPMPSRRAIAEGPSPSTSSRCRTWTGSIEGLRPL